MSLPSEEPNCSKDNDNEVADKMEGIKLDCSNSIDAGLTRNADGGDPANPTTADTSETVTAVKKMKKSKKVRRDLESADLAEDRIVPEVAMKDKDPATAKFWFEFDTPENTSHLLLNSFPTLVQSLELCANWQNHLPAPEIPESRASKSLISKHCESIISKIQAEYKVNFITERELNTQVIPLVGSNSAQVASSWKLTLVLLDVLGQLRLAIEKEEAQQPESQQGIEVLSLGAKLNLAKVIEFVTGFGILQNISEEVNLLPSSSYSRDYVQKMSAEVKQTSMTRFYRLSYVLDVMCFIIKCPLIESRLQKIQLQLLVSALHILHGPVDKPAPINDSNEEGPKKKRSLKCRSENKDNPKIIQDNVQFELIQELKAGLEEPIQFHFFRECLSESQLSFKYQDNLFSIRAKAKVITSLLAFGSMKNPKWIKRAASQHSTKILLNDPFGLHIYFVALTDNQRQGRGGTTSSDDTFWTVAGTIGTFLSCILMELNDQIQKQGAFISFMSDQALHMIMSHSQLRIHELVGEEDGEATKRKTSEQILNANKKSIFTFGIIAAYYLTKFEPMMLTINLWTPLYHDWLVLPTTLNNIMDMLEITQTFLSCRRLNSTSTGSAATNDSSSHLTSLIHIWRIHFFTYVATRNYLEGPVQSVTMVEKLTKLEAKLGLLLIELVETFYMTTNLRICELLCNLTYNLDAQNNPCALTLHWAEKAIDERTNSLEIQLQIKPTENLMDLTKNRELYNGIDAGVKVLSKLLLTSNNKLTDILPALFKELLEEDVRSEADIRLINPLADLEPAKILEVFNLDNKNECSRLASILLLSSFENNIEPIIESLGMDDGEKAVSYLILIFRKLVIQIEESATKGVEFVFKDTLMSLLNTTSTVMDIYHAFHKVKKPPASLNVHSVAMSWDGFAPLIPYLHRLRECNHPELQNNEAIQEAINDCHIRIVTHCKGVNPKSGKKEQELEPYYVALQESNDPLPYIQANGLLNFRRLLEKKDELALANRNVIRGVFQSALENSDPYVYLQAIRGLELMGSKWSSECVPKLIADYKRGLFSENNKSDINRYVAVTKLGETLTKIMKDLGPFVSIYRNNLFDATICLMRDKDPMLRASGMSTLAELCELLEIRLQDFITHVWEMITGFALEKEVIVRRAAFHLATKSFRGISNLIERDGTSILCESETYGRFLRDGSQKIKQWLNFESDEQCRLHLELAYDELQRIFKALVTVPETNVLEKKITIFGS